MAYSKQDVQLKHPNYEQNSGRWRFLLDSYLGGADYARGEYLTRYVYESREEYANRLNQTPLDNHVKSVISIYNSFIFAKPPKREFNDFADDPLLLDFLADSDYDGRSWDAFMREADVQASIFGSAWIIVDKPPVTLTTRAEEIASGVRPYVSLYSPLAVLDWQYERAINGRYELQFLKVYSNSGRDYDDFTLYYPDRTELIRMRQDATETELLAVYPNALGYIPAVCVYSTRSHIRGIGISDVGDIADTQRAIYDELSEIEQLIRISNHPSLVSTQEVQASAGAGARIIIPENQAGDIKPYLLQPTAQSLDGIRNSIKDKIESINQMANVSSVRSTQGRSVSGVALQTEFTLLNAHLTQKADNLELAEEQVFEIIFDWMGYADAEFYIDYPESFNTRDRINDLLLLERAKMIYALPTTGNPVMDSEINKAIIEIAIEDEEGRKEASDYVEQQELESGIEEADQIENRTYPDGEIIPAQLPPAYQPATNAAVPEGQNCGNCGYYQADQQYCVKFAAPVRAVYWCAKWEAVEAADSDMQAEIQDLLMSGLTNAEIIAQLGVSLDDIVEAAAEAARNNN